MDSWVKANDSRGDGVMQSPSQASFLSAEQKVGTLEGFRAEHLHGCSIKFLLKELHSVSHSILDKIVCVSFLILEEAG